MYRILAVFLAITIIAFIIFVSDQRRKQHGMPRLHPTLLLNIAVLGGGLGGYLASLFSKAKSDSYQLRKWIPRLAVVDIVVVALTMWVAFILTTPKCPFCGSRDVVVIAYGENARTNQDLRRFVKRGKGTVLNYKVAGDTSRYRCKHCNSKFGEQDL